MLSSSSLGKITSTNAISDMSEEEKEEEEEIVSDEKVSPSNAVARGSSPLVNLPPMIEVDDADDEDDEKAPSEEGSEPLDQISSSKEESVLKKNGDIKVIGLGFVTQMAEFMVAADVLISKAGPGTIAEAASLSLPVMLTSFLPGQEEGNVDFVVDGGFGAFVSDRDPATVAKEVGKWLVDEEKAKALSRAAKKCGAPHAARDIVKSIGSLTLKWKQINDDRERLNRAAEKLKLGISSYEEDESIEQSLSMTENHIAST
jgi:hypothetical protein